MAEEAAIATSILNKEGADVLHREEVIVVKKEGHHCCRLSRAVFIGLEETLLEAADGSKSLPLLTITVIK